ncbi:uncharacterized protein LOC109794012 [Cajanus cajan]|uniref:uncharacterized protein LOC109794012 n=1 Tax=Cajanus cajan TaxID=3821 RepID=UPI00098D9050|nr:uncharacterized protein LOC109794012 [Cajanus cajan]
MASLSRFLSKLAYKALPLFQCLKKNDRFAWTNECEEAFTELKKSLASPPILTKTAVESSHIDLHIGIRLSSQCSAGPRARRHPSSGILRESGPTRHQNKVSEDREIGSCNTGYSAEVKTLFPEL